MFIQINDILMLKFSPKQRMQTCTACYSRIAWATAYGFQDVEETHRKTRTEFLNNCREF